MSADRKRTRVVASGIHAIDLDFRDRSSAVAAYLVQGPTGLALIETGPSTVREELEAGVREAGFSMSDVDTAIVTHIHLDHAGGAGTLAHMYPKLKVWVHPVGAPHLVDNAKLVKSAGRIYGDDMDMLWGDIDNVPENQVAIAEDRVAIDIGGRTLIPHFTPGHASHHLALLDEQTGSLFTGDVAGVRIPGTGLVVPPMPPPDIDLDGWNRSIDLMLDIAPEQLFLTHFGAFDDVEPHLTQLRENIPTLMEIGRDVLVPGGTQDALTSRLASWLREGLGDDADRVWDAHDAANPVYMSSMGIHRVLRKAGEIEA